MQWNSYHPPFCNTYPRPTNFGPMNRFNTPLYGNHYVRFGDPGIVGNINYNNSPQQYPGQYQNQGLRMAFLQNCNRLPSTVPFFPSPPPASSSSSFPLYFQLPSLSSLSISLSNLPFHLNLYFLFKFIRREEKKAEKKFEK